MWKPSLLRDELNETDTEKLFDYCGYILIVCSNLVVVFFLLKKGPLYMREAWK